MRNNKEEKKETLEEKKPVRMCIICREKKQKENLYRLSMEKDKYSFDKYQKIQARGIYVCKGPICIEKLSKNKKYKIDIEVLMQLLNDIKKNKKNIVQQLTPLGNIKQKVFGIKAVREKIWKNELKLVIVAEDISEKNKDKIISDCIEKNIKCFIKGKKIEIGQVFGKNEINVIGVLDEKIAFGLIKSLGGEPVEGT